MKYMDYAAMGAAFSASQRASEAVGEIERLQNQIDAMNLMRWDDREEREFQKWIEEFIYQFGKTIGRIETTPGDPVADFQEIASYLKMIEEKQINTRVISGLENKKVFEDVLTRAEKLCGELWKNPKIVKYRNLQRDLAMRQRHVRARLAEEKIQVEKRANKLKRNRLMMGIVAGILLGIIGLAAVESINNPNPSKAPFFLSLFIAWCGYWAVMENIWRKRL